MIAKASRGNFHLLPPAYFTPAPLPIPARSAWFFATLQSTRINARWRCQPDSPLILLRLFRSSTMRASRKAEIFPFT